MRWYDSSDSSSYYSESDTDSSSHMYREAFRTFIGFPHRPPRPDTTPSWNSGTSTSSSSFHPIVHGDHIPSQQTTTSTRTNNVDPQLTASAEMDYAFMNSFSNNPPSTLLLGLSYTIVGAFHRWNQALIARVITHHGGSVKSSTNVNAAIVSQSTYNQYCRGSKKPNNLEQCIRRKLPLIKLDYIVDCVKQKKVLAYRSPYVWPKPSNDTTASRNSTQSTQRQRVTPQVIDNAEDIYKRINPIDTLVLAKNYKDAADALVTLSTSIPKDLQCTSPSLKEAKSFYWAYRALVATIMFQDQQQFPRDLIMNLVQRALTLDIKNSLAYFLRGKLNERNSLNQEAIQDYKTYIQMNEEAVAKESDKKTNEKDANTKQASEKSETSNEKTNQDKLNTTKGTISSVSQNNHHSDNSSKITTNQTEKSTQPAVTVVNPISALNVQIHRYVDDAKAGVNRILAHIYASRMSAFSRADAKKYSDIAKNTELTLEQKRERMLKVASKRIVNRMFGISEHIDLTDGKVVLDQVEKQFNKRMETRLDDIQLTGNAFTGLCPITCCPMVRPVKSLCNHVFSEEGILHLLKNRHHIQCPVSGCSKPILRSQLTYDAATEQILKEMNMEDEDVGDISTSDEDDIPAHARTSVAPPVPEIPRRTIPNTVAVEDHDGYQVHRTGQGSSVIVLD